MGESITDSKEVGERLTAHVVAMSEGGRADMLDSLVDPGTDLGQGSTEEKLLRFFDTELSDEERAIYLQSFEDNLDSGEVPWKRQESGSEEEDDEDPEKGITDDDEPKQARDQAGRFVNKMEAQHGDVRRIYPSMVDKR